jgi:hypothetical protein
MNISKKNIIADFKLFKKKAIYYGIKKNVYKSVKYSEVAAKIGYNFNFKYTDDELENNINHIASLLLRKNLNFTGNQNRIVFYDSFSIDNKGLTQQYLRAIFSWNLELLYITPQKKIGHQILKELNDYPKSKILILSKKSFENNLKTGIDSILQFKPGKTFLHFSPWDIFGFVLWTQINSTERFFINLTDHAFWLGKTCIDYILEYRNYGISISEKMRNIPKEKILHQAFYPIISSSPFLGFPISRKEKIIAFAGSSYYKTYGENFLFLNLMKEVLCQNENLIFLFAGFGNDKPIRKFIKDNQLETCFFLIGNRKDISEFFRNIDIYVNTYPLSGGLMTQYAAIMNKPIIGFSDEKLYSCNDIEDLLGLESKGLLIKKTKESFIKYFNELINDEAKRDENILFTKNAVLNKANFNISLKKTIENKKSNTKKHQIKIYQTKLFDTYIDIENNFLKAYNKMLFKSLKYLSIVNKPIKFILFLFSFFIRKIIQYIKF